MSIKFRCPSCQSQLSVSNGMAGSIVDCPRCRNKIAIPLAGLPVHKAQEMARITQTANDRFSVNKPEPLRDRKPQRGTKTTNAVSVKITCPSCGAIGEVPDQPELNPRPLRCRKCGTKFQRTPPASVGFQMPVSSARDNASNHAVDIDDGVTDALSGLKITPDGGSPSLRSGKKLFRKTGNVGFLKTIITALAIAWNCFLVYPAVIQTILSGLQAKNQTRPIAGGTMEVVYRNGTPWDIQSRGESSLTFFMFVLVAFFAVSMPFLGAFITNAKRRGIAEGYDLVTFFGPVGLIVALCLPTNRDNIGHLRI